MIRPLNIRRSVRSGDYCESCEQGRYYVAKSLRSRDDSLQIQTLRCRECGHYHDGKCVVPAGAVRRRKSTT